MPEGLLQQGDDILIVDDICDGGATFLKIAKELPNTNLYLYVTHGIFSKGLGDLSRYFIKIFSTDSFPSPVIGLFQFGKELLTKIPCEGYIKGQIEALGDIWNNAISTKEA